MLSTTAYPQSYVASLLERAGVACCASSVHWFLLTGHPEQAEARLACCETLIGMAKRYGCEPLVRIALARGELSRAAEIVNANVTLARNHRHP